MEYRSLASCALLASAASPALGFGYFPRHHKTPSAASGSASNSALPPTWQNVFSLRKAGTGRINAFTTDGCDDPAPANLMRSERGDIILKPLADKDATQASEEGLVLVPGADTAPEDYLLLAQRLQAQSSHPLWVGIEKLEFTLDVPSLGEVCFDRFTHPLQIKQDTDNLIASMRDQGMRAKKTFLAGHSLGGVFLRHVIDGTNSYAGLIHLSSFMSRDAGKDYSQDKALQDFFPAVSVLGELAMHGEKKTLKALVEAFVEQAHPETDLSSGLANLYAFISRSVGGEKLAEQLPRLTLSGELDGLTRISRIAEAYYHDIAATDDVEQSSLERPVVVIEGANHGQFISSGQLPWLVRERDLEAEVPDARVQKKIVQAMADFIDVHAAFNEESTARAQSSLIEQVKRTETLVKPFLKAMEYEGSYHLKTPCFDEDNADPDDCLLGAPFMADAQAIVAGPEGDQLQVHDEAHPSWEINLPIQLPWMETKDKPLFHHPSVDTVVERERADPLVKVSTKSHAAYGWQDHLGDTGLWPNAATKVRGKFNSRESILRALDKPAQFPASERPNVCCLVNVKMMQWAIDNASEQARERYLNRGIPLIPGVDIEVNNGPSWIWADFNKELRQDEHGKYYYNLDSTSMKTAVDHWVPYAGGKVFCTVLSPAAAMDHIYTESLRPVSQVLFETPKK